MEPKTQEQKLQLLKETVAYYSKDTKRINAGELAECGIRVCCYSGTTLDNDSEGCAIGRLLSLELRQFLDSEYVLNQKSSGLKNIFIHLPEDIKAYGKEFLFQLQILHDDVRNWNEKGLTPIGKGKVTRMKTSINKNIF